MSVLADKIRRARETNIDVGGHTFTIRRPTDAEAAAGITPMGLVHDYVVGWALKEIDLIPGGNPTPAKFDSEAWREWVADRPELWSPITEAVMAAYTAHREAKDSAAKN